MIDPKPDLSRAALEANIEYCQAKQQQHLALVKKFELKEQEFFQLLAKLNE